jgi:hyperosmotically inducible periplasmic protein
MQGIQKSRLAICVTALATTLACNAQEPVRSDAALSTEVETQLALQEDLADAQIDAVALNGEVTLNGTVPSESARARAEDVDGVSGVTNRLRVAGAAVGAPADDR